MGFLRNVQTHPHPVLPPEGEGTLHFSSKQMKDYTGADNGSACIKRH